MAKVYMAELELSFVLSHLCTASMQHTLMSSAASSGLSMFWTADMMVTQLVSKPRMYKGRFAASAGSLNKRGSLQLTGTSSFEDCTAGQ